ncbi:helix-turn-helix domain-containing protein [Ligilactobacillus acidipiscis]|uniref:helix-turn-helix domain-containing protein n=1 Tax=Ligilactobacillus acidipiscis TaxID=89059 RepID=UPI0022E61440|nr:helix-turn-helix transcriptional regulator [Ligilactobacillus acidipiscis]
MTTFERIKKVADIRKISLRDVAKKAGMKSETAIYRYNQGVTPRKSTLIAIAEALNVSPDYLSGKTDDMNEAKQKQADLADDSTLFTYEGKPIDDEDKEIIRRLLRGK